MNAPFRSVRHAILVARTRFDVRRLGTVPAPLIVYQMGKVGSSTVRRSLVSAFPDRPVWQPHTLVPEKVAAMRAVHAAEAGAAGLPSHWILEAALSRAVARAGDEVPYYVASLVRDPIARELSALFQNPKRARAPIAKADGTVDAPRALAYAREELARPAAFEYLDAWFDLEIKRVFGVDVFAQPFDAARGYEVLVRGPVRTLVLRVEDLERTFATGVREWLAVAREVPIVRTGVRENLAGADAYRWVRERLRFPAEVLDRIYASRFSCHFYSEDERQGFKRRWQQA